MSIVYRTFNFHIPGSFFEKQIIENVKESEYENNY